MPGAVLHPEEVGASDAARVLGFVNAATDAETLAEVIGLSEGMQIGRRVARAILAERDASGGLQSLVELMSITGITLSRFTEIVTALSNARPVRAGGRLRLTPSSQTPWLGQSIGITGQVLDEDRRGVPGTTVTCFTSAGVLSAQAGLEQQAGSSVHLVTEPGGVIRFSYAPLIAPPLARGPRAALEAELSRLDVKAETPNDAADALKAMAVRYRSQGGTLLRGAVDRLFQTFPADAQNPASPWALMPVSLIAVAGGPEGRAELMTVITLYVRNWLGGWLQVLRGLIEGDTRLDEALKNLDKAAEEGADLSLEIVRATQAFAGLELGAQGQKLRDEHAGGQINAFLERVAPNLTDSAIVNTVRAAGASGAAIQGGGFAVFDAIRNVQDVEDTIAPPRLDAGKFAGQLEQFGTRLGQLEEVAVDRNALDGLRSELTGSLSTAEANLTGALSDLKSQFDASVRSVQNDVGGLTRRLGKLEEFQIDEATFRDLRKQISDARTQLGALQTQLETVQADSVTRTDLGALEASLTQRLTADFKTSLDRVQRDFGTAIERVRADFELKIGGVRDNMTGLVAEVRDDLSTRIDGKADAGKLGELTADFQLLKQENQTLTGRVDGFDAELRTIRVIGPTRPIGPIGPTG